MHGIRDCSKMSLLIDLFMTMVREIYFKLVLTCFLKQNFDKTKTYI